MTTSPSPPAAWQVRLTVIAGPHTGKTFVFDRHDTFIVGRGKQAHFRLPREDEFFSRTHFLVEVNPPHCRLIDLGSTNGTTVNGQKVTTIDLHDGDRIEGGQTRLRVSIVEDDDEAVTRRAEPQVAHLLPAPPPEPGPHETILPQP